MAIVGGGFVGLWTALRIKQCDPATDVVVLEQDICGGGASGRNGGMVLSWWPKIASLVALCGEEEAHWLVRASESAIDDLQEFCEAQGIDCGLRKGGLLWTATTPAQIDSWKSVVDISERLGASVFQRLDPSEVARRTGSETHIDGVFDRQAATLQPASLVRGLRRVAIELGVRIFEGTQMTGFSRERPVKIRCGGKGLLTAEKLVIATNAWAAGLPELKRSLVVVSSDIVVTAPVPGLLEEIGWCDDEGITDSQMMVNYYRTTSDGRVVFGKGTAGLPFANRIGEDLDYSPKRCATVASEFRRSYPQLAGVPIEYGWGGAIDRTANSLPVFGHLGGRDHILYGVGWSGNGVGPSLLGGRILASLALGLRDDWSQNRLVNRPHDRFPPEPIRYLGGHLVRRAVHKKDTAEIEGRSPGFVSSTLAKFAPAGLEDKS